MDVDLHGDAQQIAPFDFMSINDRLVKFECLFFTRWHHISKLQIMLFVKMHLPGSPYLQKPSEFESYIQSLICFFVFFQNRQVLWVSDYFLVSNQQAIWWNPFNLHIICNPLQRDASFLVKYVYAFLLINIKDKVNIWIYPSANM